MTDRPAVAALRATSLERRIRELIRLQDREARRAAELFVAQGRSFHVSTWPTDLTDQHPTQWGDV